MHSMCQGRHLSWMLRLWIATAVTGLTTPELRAQTDFEIAPEERLAVGDEYEIPSGTAVCERTIKATVVAIDQVIFFNRLMVCLPSGMIYALERDVVPIDTSKPIGKGNARLRRDKRPRPLVLRMNVGDCLEVTFKNWLAEERVDEGQPATRNASMHVEGLSLVGSIASSGSNVGLNDSSLAAPGETRLYKWHASKEGAFLVQSAGALTGGEGDGGQPDHGLFGAINVEPKDSIWYRSQLTEEEHELIDPNGTRLIDYDAKYPDNHPDPKRQGRPVVEILDEHADGTLEIFHSDLNAIIADIPDDNYPPVAVAAPLRDRNEPFREFTIIYHDENALVQAFPVLETEFFAHSIRDNMAINYGTGGIGAEIISYGADQIVGGNTHIPAGMAAKCNDCKYEEAFLSSWAVGDPAMVFEREDPPPSTDPDDDHPDPTQPAVRALYPDDPSNVHHSYLNDHVKMRVLHGGVAEHHIHHLHAHQWLHQQNSDNSAYYDSQAIGPGSSFTLDIVYNGGGNRNKTPGDSIFHCHFYPHFAQGMWELWRVHDVYEDGSRVLPDAELEDGTPIPALVPLPGLAMAPLPTASFPGFPFYIPGRVGHRPPTPPLDHVFDGGLPRHVVRGGKVRDGLRGPFDRIHLEMDALELPDGGTPEELAAMSFHAIRQHPSVTPEGDPARFITNGLPAQPGAPFADPCVDDLGNPTGNPKVIKAVAFQIDAKFNKAGWHFDQWRMLSHWGDWNDYRTAARAPEPFFMRVHSNDCIEFHHTNLIPNVYRVDDFQIFTPTDVVGQHIHLVKFDVTASDGAGNGWNYEDGTHSPDEVIERITAINAVGGIDLGNGQREILHPEAHPFFGVLGAQTTIQRWWADPVLNLNGDDRTLRTVFTHDHFGPSTHQQAGLYAGLLVEKADTVWRDPESGAIFGNRDLGGSFGKDGGPTSWRADILFPNQPEKDFREFMLESQDFHLAYRQDGTPVNPPGRVEIPLPHLVDPPPEPMPEGVSADDVGTFSVNYRNEPLALRIRDPMSNGQATGIPGDLAHAYRSNVDRKDDDFDVQPGFYPPLTNDMQPGDPFTPLMRVYEGDRVQVRLLQGATEEGHNMTIHGLRWKHEPDDPNSMYKNSQMNGISEHFEFEAGILPDIVGLARQADYLYQPGASVDDQWNGNWGLLRQYQGVRDDLLPLPGNLDGELPRQKFNESSDEEKTGPDSSPRRYFDITAVRVGDVLPEQTLIYNQGHQLNDPTALMYVLTSDLDPQTGMLKDDVPREPLILRANAGDLIDVVLRNGFEATPKDDVGFNLWPMIVERFNANQTRPSSSVGLHPQLVHYDVRRANGINAGFNPISTVPLNGVIRYRWYAGKIDVDDQTGNVTATPVEFGATNLMPADTMKHSNKGLIGSLIIQPRGSTWTLPSSKTRAVADVSYPDPQNPVNRLEYREFVMIFQDDINLYLEDGSPVPPVAGGTVQDPSVEDPEDSANKAINYRTEPMWTRLGYPPGLPLTSDGGGGGGGAPSNTNDIDFTNAMSIAATGPIETPIFEASVGMPVRFRVLHPQGHPRNHVITLHGHLWRHEPGNPVGEFIGSQAGHGPSDHWNLIPLHGAGGAFGVPGDYLYRNHTSMLHDGGIWGVFRVKE